MQATIARPLPASKTLVVMLALLAGLILGGVGGYFVSDLSRTTASATVSATNSASSSYAASLAASAARHAAQERADSGSAYGLGQNLEQFRAGERASADPSPLATP